MAGISDEELRELDEAYEAMMEEQRKMKALEDDLTPFVKKIIVKNYPETFHLESEGYKALDDAIWRNIDKLVTDVNQIANTMGEEK
jgi:hypothetical protein